MSKIKKKSEWVPLKYDAQFLSGNLEGLRGIEVLEDYNIVSDDKKPTRKRVKDKEEIIEEPPIKKKKNKEKSLSAKTIKEDELQSDKKKKRPKKKNKNNSKSKQIENESIDESDSDELETEEVETENNEDENELEDSQKMNIDPLVWLKLGVPGVVIKALNDENFQKPTLIQSLTLPPAILGFRDILGAAETGSGKTLAFGIPIINGILDLKKAKEKGIENESDDDESVEENNEEVEDEHSEVDDEKDEVEDEETLSEEEEYESEDKEIDSNEEEEILNDGTGIGLVKVEHLPDSQTDISVEKPLYALILTPTRELAIQIKNHLNKAAKYTDLKIAVIVGGMAAVKQERILSKGPEIVIATPGRLWELVSGGNPHLNQLHSIRFLAIDETDRMLEKGHFQELHDIMERVNADEKKVAKRQNFVFSATLSLVHELPDHLYRKKILHNKRRIKKLSSEQKLQKVIEMLKMKNPKVVDITEEKGIAEGLTECRIACTLEHKDYYLYYFLKRHPGRTLVFCNSIGCVRRLATLFAILDCKPLPLHASMIQKQRLKNLERFQADDNGLLIATDVAARGLDIPNVDHVIHYQVPRTSESYVHRSGRSARAQKEGITVLLMEPSEKEFYTRLCKTLGRCHDIPTFPVEDNLLVSVKERINVAREIDKLELICKRDNGQKDWIRKAAEDMDLVLEDEHKNSVMNKKETADLKRQLKIKRRQLKSLILKPLFPKGFSGKYPELNCNLTLEQNSEKAIDVMKKAIEEMPMKKRDRATIVAAKKNRKILKAKLKKERRSKKRQDKDNQRKKRTEE